MEPVHRALSMEHPVQDRDRILTWALFCLSVLLLLQGVFALPFLYPPSSHVLSASSVSGFNNALAYYWYVAVLGLPVWLLARLLPVQGGGFITLEPGTVFRAPTTAVSVTLLAHIVLFTALYRYKNGFVFAEALYFQDIIYRMQSGAVPFLDVHFFYGPLLLYPPAFLAGFMPIELAYAIFYVAVYTLGLYFLYLVLASLLSSQRDADLWFLFFAWGFFNPYTGLNYTLVRHLLPAIAIVAAWWYFRDRRVFSFCMVVAIVVLSITYSPEIGLVTVVTLVFFNALLIYTQSSKSEVRSQIVAHGAVLLTVFLVSGLLFSLIDPTFHVLQVYVEPILTFSSGGWNTPIDPSLPMLTMMTLTIGVGAVVLYQLQRKGWDESVCWLVSYGVMVLLMQRAAFGKADVAHIAYGGLPLYLASVSLVAAVRHVRLCRRWVAGILIVGMIVPLQFYHGMQFAPYVMKRMGALHGSSSQHQSAKTNIDKEAVQASIAKVVDRFGTNQLYYMHKLEYYRFPLYTRFHLKPILYYPSLTSAFTADDIRRVIGQLQVARAIVIARKHDLAQCLDGAPKRGHWTHFIMASPLPGSTIFELTKHFQCELEKPLLDFITVSYEPRFEDGPIIALVPRNL